MRITKRYNNKRYLYVRAKVASARVLFSVHHNLMTLLRHRLVPPLMLTICPLLHRPAAAPKVLSISVRDRRDASTDSEPLAARKMLPVNDSWFRIGYPQRREEGGRVQQHCEHHASWSIVRVRKHKTAAGRLKNGGTVNAQRMVRLCHHGRRQRVTSILTATSSKQCSVHRLNHWHWCPISICCCCCSHY